jgi:hypothetical protein
LAVAGGKYMLHRLVQDVFDNAGYRADP